MRRAQISTEFMFIMGFATFILLAYLFIAVYAQQDARDDEHQASAERIASLLRQELITASAVLDGYTRTFELPSEVRNRPVTFEVRPRAVIVRVGDQEAYARTPDFNGTPQPGTNILMKRDGKVSFT